MLNKIILMGRLTRDPELRYTKTNVPVATFRLAVDRGVRPDPSNPQQQTADFIDVVSWRDQAEFVSKYFHKGQLVAVAGRIQQRDWKDRDGNSRTTFEVVASEVHFAEKRGDSQGGGNYPPPGAAYAGPEPGAARAQNAPEPVGLSSGFAELEDDDGELPF